MKYIFFLLILLGTLIGYSQNQSISIAPVTTSHVEVTDNSLIDFSTNLTIEAWITVPDILGSRSIVHKGWCGISDASYYFGLEGGKLVHSWSEVGSGNCNFTSTSKTTESVIIPNRCTHIAVVHSSNSIKFYVDGDLVATTLIGAGFNGLHNSSEPLRIGIYKNLAGSLVLPMVGLLDEVRLWNVARTASEIDDSKNLALIGNEIGLVAYYNFDNVTAALGNVVTNNCTITGTVLNGVVSGSSPFQMATACESLSSLNIDNSIEMNKENHAVVSVYPNPSSSELIIKLSDFKNVKLIELIDLTGAILDKKVPSTELVTFSLLDLKVGSYFLKVYSADGIIETRIILKN